MKKNKKEKNIFVDNSFDKLNKQKSYTSNQVWVIPCTFSENEFSGNLLQTHVTRFI